MPWELIWYKSSNSGFKDILFFWLCSKLKMVSVLTTLNYVLKMYMIYTFIA